MQINVTQDHIDKGKKDSCHGCPIALALTEQIPLPNGHKWCARRDHAKIHVELLAEKPANYDFYNYGGTPLSWNAESFIRDFDSSMPVEPFSFEFDYKQEELECAGKQQTSAV